MELRLTLSEKEKEEIVAALRRGVEPKILPVTLSPAQMDELVRRVTVMLKAEPLKISLPAEEQEKFVDDVAARFKNRPIILTDEQKNELGKFVWLKFWERMGE
ncbi:MAG: hypothetical protein IJP42_03265 [Selenomonadaceae bacterium]|nr:hypothetical protein [Selenomonadaceae bacterium]MBR0060480.1 hypothetical protein [Selenomonadaceae bacterium]